MGNDEPILAMEGSQDGAWSITVRDLARFRTCLGDRVLRDLLRCLLWCDRLRSVSRLRDVAPARGEGPAPDPARSRDSMTMIWLQAGCVAELSETIVSLSGLDLRPRLNADGVEALEAMQEIRRRWAGKSFKDMRNIGGFHLDASAFDHAVEALVAKGASEALLAGSGLEFWSPLSGAALILATWPEGHEGGFAAKASAIREDTQRIDALVHRLLLGIVQTADARE